MPSAQGAWSKLSAGSAQVLICDLQTQIVARSKTKPPDALAQSAGVLCQVASLFKLPITFSVVPENNQAPELVAPLRPFAMPQNQFTRATANPFIEPKTREQIAAQERPVLILAGFATEVVVLHAALSAIEEGYGVLVAVDACGGMSEHTETAAFNHIRDSGGIMTSVVSVATALGPDFTQPQGQEMFQIVQSLRLA